ncbi:RuBisCO operon transcriptional regulator CbbR [Marinobacterium lacunae]|uniref:RuBisCO operon transcriptional regulator CbbR n=1 Tax=Marinobacterium lacunae TaxID=1232683 RepID=A0A081FT41_9GAMM|nr:LysR substrate-binding domain-containing protein [Marinobacterium lacunae]KEA61696.1 RuBisCO operon transcriptional regulator CbbR [Marinobacterium lacunae]
MPYTLNQLLNRLSFRQLQVFRTVYVRQNYSRAAEELGLTQPAVSAQIRQLEQTLGQPVFEYVGKQLYVTAAGEQLMLAVRAIFADLERLQMELAELQGQVRGELRLAAVSTAQYVVPYLLEGFLKQYPQIEVRLRVVNRAQAVERLNENRDDLVIMGMVPDSRSLSSMPFLDNEMVPVVRADDPLLHQANLTPQGFLDAGLLIREPGSGTRHALEDWCSRRRLSLKPKMELGSNAAIRHGIIAGLGVAVLPKLSISAELRLGELAIPDLDGFPLRRSWCTVYPSSKHPTPVMQAFLDYVRNNLNSHYSRIYGDIANR